MEKESHNITDEFGKRLRIIRNEILDTDGKSITQADIAERSGLSQNVVHRLEKGLGTSVENIIIYLNYLDQNGFNINWILSIDNTNVDKYKAQSSEHFLSNFLDKETFMSIHRNTIESSVNEINSMEEAAKNIIEFAKVTKTGLKNILKP